MRRSTNTILSVRTIWSCNIFPCRLVHYSRYKGRQVPRGHPGRHSWEARKQAGSMYELAHIPELRLPEQAEVHTDMLDDSVRSGHRLQRMAKGFFALGARPAGPHDNFHTGCHCGKTQGSAQSSVATCTRIDVMSSSCMSLGGAGRVRALAE